MRRVVSGFAVIGLALAACGGGDGGDSGSSKGKEYVDAIMATFESEEEMPIPEDDARCVAEGMVDTIGVDELEAAGVTPDDIRSASDEGGPLADFKPTETQADEMVDTMFRCVDFGDVFASSLAADESAPDIPADKVECLGDAMEQSDTFRTSLRNEFLGVETSGDDESAAFVELFEQCDISLSDLVGS
jgi:hypothetical protein